VRPFSRCHSTPSVHELRAVFGAGNHDWVATYQKVPKFCDATIEERGGHRLLARGEGDAGGAEFFQAFDDYEHKLWDALVKVSVPAFAVHFMPLTPRSGIRHN
jgi:sulfite reductase alpha subunit-like flavoprotein